MRVHVPSALLSYTGRQSEVDAAGSTLTEVLYDLDRRYPGLRFRIIDEQDNVRPHINIFVNGERVRVLDTSLTDGDDIAIMMSLSGG